MISTAPCGPGQFILHDKHCSLKLCRLTDPVTAEHQASDLSLCTPDTAAIIPSDFNVSALAALPLFCCLLYLTLALRGESPDTLDGQNRVALALTLLIPLTVVLCLAHHQPRPRHTHRLSYQL